MKRHSKWQITGGKGKSTRRRWKKRPLKTFETIDEARKYKLQNVVTNLSKRCQTSRESARNFAGGPISSLSLVAGPNDIACVYCLKPLSLGTVSFDHEIPLVRGGAVFIPNVVISCVDCNKIKGSLTGDEYRELLVMLGGWPEEASLNVKRRLKLGGSFFGRFKRRGK